MANEDKVEVKTLPIFDIEDTGASDNGNPLNENPNNQTVGGVYIVGNFVQNANGEIIGKVNRVKPQDAGRFSETIGKNDPSANLEGGSNNTETIETEAQKAARLELEKKAAEKKPT